MWSCCFVVSLIMYIYNSLHAHAHVTFILYNTCTHVHVHMYICICTCPVLPSLPLSLSSSLRESVPCGLLTSLDFLTSQLLPGPLIRHPHTSGEGGAHTHTHTHNVLYNRGCCMYIVRRFLFSNTVWTLRYHYMTYI